MCSAFLLTAPPVFLYLPLHIPLSLSLVPNGIQMCPGISLISSI